MPERDYRIHLGHSADGVALNWVIRANSELEAIQRSREWFEERLPSEGNTIEVDVYDAESGIERNNPEAPTHFQIEVDPRRFTPDNIRFRTEPISE